jgi:hypothetical protein
MPDPLLTQFDFDADYKSALQIAAFYGARIWNQDRLVFIECPCAANRTLLAQICCRGYPCELPAVTFLNPLTKRPTGDAAFWPAGAVKIGGTSGYEELCLAGTRTYAKAHGSSPSHYSLAQLAEIVINICRGRAKEIQLIPRKR